MATQPHCPGSVPPHHPFMTLSEMRQLLADRGIQLTKSLGQNFLHDAHQLHRITAAAALTPGDKVLEIGPGLGPLTGLLLEQAGEVLALETDQRLVALLNERFAGSPKLRLIHADALRWLREHPRDWRGWKLVSNLPFSVASPILVELAQAPRGPDRLVATLQLEVAQRLTAPPDSEHYGLLTLLVGLAYVPGPLFKIPGGCFFPAPEVMSACLTLDRRPLPLLPAEQIRAFARLTKLAFSQRRKKMIKLLKAAWPVPQLEAAFAELGLDPLVRGEKLSLDQFVRLTLILSPAVAPA
jgi:16S rRNA (adenine1518-N6/adenine1519-N6)-dimethyltransferase